MVRAQPDLNRSSRSRGAAAHRLPADNSFYQVLSAEWTEARTLAYYVIFDELHAQPNRHLWDVLTQGAFAAREEPRCS